MMLRVQQRPRRAHRSTTSHTGRRREHVREEGGSVWARRGYRTPRAGRPGVLSGLRIQPIRQNAYKKRNETAASFV
ncbi:hypothetical protein SORBI_3003G203866 [Sorghum bicolor]|uniref:Uncharacterized protein n=1 Tax=Sorghum bicolor TaxID=4558 RepID=A0A1W0VY94_SORBI|nr:hypothetical protein SORBI_3003G203866 [Sorghum bicolor]OQU87090.1 hypothetical protein SORBI_3003G203866 [Sorghum bicolor]OQU87092.1 hypothetical protein SORBI_3003G203866 [Sorghum bicolor]